LLKTVHFRRIYKLLRCELLAQALTTGTEHAASVEMARNPVDDDDIFPLEVQVVDAQDRVKIRFCER
jgi:hypothetical protein